MYPGPDDFHNCTRVLGRDIEVYPLGSAPLKRGDKVFSVYVTPTGPNPDVNLDARLTAHIAFHTNLDLPQGLDAMWNEARLYVMFLSPYLEGPSMGHA
jgi:hypothetical protein